MISSPRWKRKKERTTKPASRPRPIVNYYLVVAAVFATAKDRTGKQMFPRTWDLDLIALPAINKPEQNTPTLEANQIEDILSGSRGRYRVLYALLAGRGMRISEALGREIGKHLAADRSVIYVRQQRSKKGHRIETYPKTDSGIRDVDLAPELSALLKDYVANRTSRFLFETPSGLPMAPRNLAGQLASASQEDGLRFGRLSYVSSFPRTTNERCTKSAH